MLSLCCFTRPHKYGSGGAAPCILNLVNRVADFMYVPLQPWGNMRQSGPQIWSGCYGEEDNLLTLLRIESLSSMKPSCITD
jgi:hypothetical protein